MGKSCFEYLDFQKARSKDNSMEAVTFILHDEIFYLKMESPQTRVLA